MANTQMASGLPNGDYCVISNGTAQNYFGNGGTRGSLVAGAPGYDNSDGSQPGCPGTTAQGTNPYPNGTIPGYLTSGTTSTAGVLFKNPAVG